MKWSLIIPLAFIASIVMFGCSGGEEDTTYESPEGETSIQDQGDVGTTELEEGATVGGTETMSPD